MDSVRRTLRRSRSWMSRFEVGRRARLLEEVSARLGLVLLEDCRRRQRLEGGEPYERLKEVSVREVGHAVATLHLVRHVPGCRVGVGVGASEGWGAERVRVEMRVELQASQLSHESSHVMLDVRLRVQEAEHRLPPRE